MKKILFVFLLLLCGSAFAIWAIDGENIFIEDSEASLRVTPHTAISPINSYKQEFTVCNKTETQTNLFAAYIFDDALTAGKVEYWQKPAYGWIEYELTCDYDFNYIMNEDADRNPHRAWCYEIIDGNGIYENVIYWEQEFRNWNASIPSIQYEVYELVSGNNWLDVTSNFTANKQALNDRHIYPYTAGLAFEPNSCETWAIEYTPDPNTDSNKWDLWLWADSGGWNCILTDTCAKTLKLDPWWDEGSAWGYKQKITMITSEILSGDIEGDHAILVDINASNTDFWENVEDDGKDVRFVNASEDGEYDYHFELFDSGADRMIAWVEITDTFPSASNLDFYMYYGNSGASDAQDETGTYSADYSAVWHMQTGGASQADSTSGGFDLTGVNTPTTTPGKCNGATQYTKLDSEYSIEPGTFADGDATQLSWSMWIKFAETWEPAMGFSSVLLAKPQTTASWYAMAVDATGKIWWLVWDGVNPNHVINSNKASWAAGTWFHLVGTIDTAANEMRLYVNGSTDDGGTLDEAMLTITGSSTADFHLAAWPGAGSLLNGSLDEVKVFLNHVLTPDEVKLIYASENIGLLEYGEQEAGVTDSCTCPASGHWNILNGDECTLNTTCTITGDLQIEDGSLNIASGGTLALLSGKKVIIAIDQFLSIENGGTLSIAS